MAARELLLQAMTITVLLLVRTNRKPLHVRSGIMRPSQHLHRPTLRVNYVAHMLTFTLRAGVPPSGDGDAHLPRFDRTSAVHMAPKAVYLHLREPYNREATIWHEDHLHLHPDPLH